MTTKMREARNGRLTDHMGIREWCDTFMMRVSPDRDNDSASRPLLSLHNKTKRTKNQFKVIK